MRQSLKPLEKGIQPLKKGLQKNGKGRQHGIEEGKAVSPLKREAANGENPASLQNKVRNFNPKLTSKKSCENTRLSEG